MQTLWPPNLTERARTVLTLAHGLADRRGDKAVAPVDVLLGLLAEGQSVAIYVLTAHGVPLEDLASDLAAAQSASGSLADASVDREGSVGSSTIIEAAAREARELETPYWGAEHLLLAVLRDAAGVPARVLARYDLEYENARAAVRWVLNGQSELLSLPRRAG